MRKTVKTAIAVIGLLCLLFFLGDILLEWETLKEHGLVKE